MTGTDVVVFIDALTPRELEGFLEEIHQGEMDADVPRVTPRVMSGIYTGLNPAENGMMEVSKYGGEQTTRPRKSTFIDQAVRDGQRVLSMGMPFSIPFQNGNNGSILHGDALQGAQQVLPQEGAGLVQVPAPASDMIKDHPDTTYSSFLDQTRNFFTRSKEVMRHQEFDTAFLGIRLVDSYCHFQHTETRNGKPYRQHLIDHIQSLLSEIYAQIDGDLMFFCYDEETEVLTKDGWKNFDEVLDSDEVATLNQETQELEYQEPEAIAGFDYEGKMYRLDTEQVDLKVTPNHRLYRKKKDRRRTTENVWKKDYALEEAQELKGSHFRLKKDAEWSGDSPENFYLEDEDTDDTARNRPDSYNPIPIRPWLKFLGYWVGDGTLHHDEVKGNYEVMIKQSKEKHPEEYKEIMHLLDEIGVNVYEYGDSIKFYSKQIYRYLEDFWKPKRVPDFVKELSPDLIQEFIDGLLAADGYQGKLTTTSKPLSNEFQELALKTGYSVNIKTVDPSVYTSKIKGREIRSIKLRYELYLNEKSNSPIIDNQTRKAEKTQEEWVDYDGKVYCVSVPNSVIYVRRNGKPVWCGNSDHGQTELTHTFRVNRWLNENGWLDYKVDYDFIDTLEEYQGGEMHPVNERVENQFTFGRPGVKLLEESSQVVCADPFDSCLTLLCDREDFDEEKFREELMDTGLFRSVKYKWELYDEDADFYESVPDIIPDRDEGVFVSGNLHKNPIGMGYYRTGVHDREACFGATKELDIPDKDTIKPEDMYDVITDFIGLEVTESPLQMQQVKQWTKDEVELAHENIEEALGNKPGIGQQDIDTGDDE